MLTILSARKLSVSKPSSEAESLNHHLPDEDEKKEDEVYISPDEDAITMDDIKQHPLSSEVSHSTATDKFKSTLVKQLSDALISGFPNLWRISWDLANGKYVWVWTFIQMHLISQDSGSNEMKDKTPKTRFEIQLLLLISLG